MHPRPRQPHRRRGVASMLAMLELLAAGTVSNASGNQMTTAINLSNNIHEIALALPFRDPEQPAR